VSRPARNGAANGNRGQGSKWIRPEKRERIYARDGWRCCWCECAVAGARHIAAAVRVGYDPAQLQRVACLDHFIGRAAGGSNAASNLLTSCMQCNDERGELSALAYASKLARAKALAAGATRDREALYRFEILERCLRALDAPLLTLEERSAA
jgi:5-methylcytosine-specific restriction endonuclease McrA